MSDEVAQETTPVAAAPGAESPVCLSGLKFTTIEPLLPTKEI